MKICDIMETVDSRLIDKKYPPINGLISGLRVSDKIDNYSSIRASFDDFEILKGLREIPMKDFSQKTTDYFYSKDDMQRARELAAKIENSGWISPLIVVIDEEGPYILEGAHRMVALILLKKETFPALVVLDFDR